ncbi:hypothetical protein II5_03153 [Bacillus cereus MSX-A1]|uniref:hypothetical protein n=1 Tax=Bacillus TaxID=1386 RepID=UPI0002796FE8|nr:hypothetical protein [Bacillus cereus]EJR05163.1 hypothetical protein II5_03153 [Bacillus cereus MSX-A1]MDR4291369.1 hypothetical protein [Bacillus cereus]
MLIGEDGEVENIDLNEEQSAMLAFKASVNIVANVSYMDSASSYYDKEEGKYLYTEYVDSVIDDVIEVPVLMKIKFEHYNKEEMDIISTSLNKGEPIQISIQEKY